ncbi:MAG: M24 family metallopeptidase, partial [Alphaproteobacteria bacterium]
MRTAAEIKMNQHDRLAFSLGEYRRRYDLVAKGMERAGIDVLLIRTPENICYLTGYETPGYYAYHCLVVAADQDPVLVVRKLEQMNVWEFAWLDQSVTVEDDEVPWEVTIRTLKARGLADKTIGVEETAFFSPIAEYKALLQALPEARIVDGSGVVEAARVVKSDEEIALMRRTAKILDTGMQAAIDATEAGRTEDEIAAVVHKVLVEQGSEYWSLPHFVCSGERASVTHATWRGRRLEKGDVGYYELSAVKHRYNTALLLTVSDGDPGAKVRAMADASLAALEAAKRAIRPGVTCDEVYWACHNAIVERGLGEHHPHRAGYSIGISFPPDWGEGHILSLKKKEMRRLEPNMTFHIIPAIQIYREVGVC